MKSKAIRVLMIEQSEEDARLIIRELKKGGYKPVYERIKTIAAMKKAFKNNKWDILLCEYKMPNFTAPSAITSLKEANIDIPVIVVTGAVGEETAADCMRLGAKDYIMKGNLSRLCPAIERELEDTEIREKKRLAEKELHLNEDKYRLLFENAGEGILIIQGDMIKFANPALETIIGYPKEIITTRKFSSFIHPDDRSMVLDRHMQRMSGKPVETGYRFRIVAADKKQRWLYIVSRTIVWDGVPSSLNFVMDITSHKQAEDELLASEEKYRLIFENAPLGLLSFNEKGVIIACNDNFVKIIGSSRDKLIGLNMLNLPDKKIVSAVRRALKGSPGFYEGEYSSVTAKKTTPVRCLFTPMDVGPGRIPGGVGIIEDITEHKRAEKALQESEERFRRISSIISDINYSCSTKEGGRFSIDWMIGATEHISGYSIEEIKAQKCWRFLVVEEDMSLFEKNVIGLAPGSHGFCELRIHNKNGGIVWIASYAECFIDKRAPEHFILYGALVDITEHKQANAQLLESEKRYRSLVENAQEGIFQTTPEGKFRMANRAMATILGYDSPRELMESVTDIKRQIYVNSRDRIRILETLDIHNIIRKGELQFYRKDGSVIWVFGNVQSVRDKNGKVLYYEGIIEDITDRKNNADQLRKALGGTVQAIASLVESRDPYTAGHQRRVAELAAAIAKEMGLSPEQIEGLSMAGIIHDIGKVSVPSDILNIPRKLTAIEFGLVQTHVQSGYDIVKDIEFPWPVARMILEHHERMNGAGYPNALTGDKMLLESRIMAVADVVEAMASHRPYRPALGFDAALEEISGKRGILYDSAVVDACLLLFRKKGYAFKEHTHTRTSLSF